MSYSEENGQVVLRMSPEDYSLFDLIFNAIIYDYAHEPTKCQHALEVIVKTMQTLYDRLNEGNPNYTPYQVPEKKP